MNPTIGAGVAFGRAESRAERIRGDDDPVLIPRWVALGSFTLEARDIADLDPQSHRIGKKPRGKVSAAL
jgi:hypothetical protein